MKDNTCKMRQEERTGSDEYRRRVYGAYVTARSAALAPSSIQDLRPRAAQQNNLIRAYFPRDRSSEIIDLGCGHGALIHFAREAGYRNITGIDRSLQQVEAARRLGINGIRCAELVEEISSMENNSFDAIVTFDVIEHFHKDELISFVDQVLRVLRSKGRWIIHAPNGESPFASMIRYGDFTHELAFTKESLSQLLLSSGFARVDCYEDGPAAHGPVSAVRYLLWKVIRSGLRFILAVETGDVGINAIYSQNLFAVAIK
jgi:cyclopropane fatty-acyl-phospholipid synthase-like methyltransferase